MTNQQALEKDDRIWEKLKGHFLKIGFGMMSVEFKIQDGKIVLAEIIQERIKIG